MTVRSPVHSSWFCLPLALLLLASRAGFAQDVAPRPPDAPVAPGAPLPRAPDAPLPGTAKPTPRRLLEAPARPSGEVRVAAEAGASLLTGLGGGVLGFMAGFGLSSDARGASIAVPVATVVGFGLGAATGAFWGGEVAGGESNFGAPLLGMALGGAVGLVPALLIEDRPMIALLVSPPLMLLGSVIGYEVAEHGDVPRKVQPVMSLTRGGARFGLAGTF